MEIISLLSCPAKDFGVSCVFGCAVALGSLQCAR
jgi:hypothetical protein